jgi:CobQ-like glutamine amidotransferase family enzyme
MRAQLSALSDFVAAGRPLLVVCGSYQRLGHSYTFELDGQATTVQGLGLIDMTTSTSQPRLIGDIEIEAELTGPATASHSPADSLASKTTLGEHLLGLQ